MRQRIFELASRDKVTWFLRGSAGLFSIPAVVLMSSFIGFGSLARESGIGLEHTVFMTATIWALPSQIVLVGAIAAGSGLLATMLAVVLVSVRFTPMIAAWVPVVRDDNTSRRLLLVLSHFVAITSWVFSMSKLPDVDPAMRRAYFAGFAVTLTSVNILVTAIGYQAAAALPLMVVGALFMLTPVYFLFSLLRAAKDRAELTALGLGLALGPILAIWLPSFALVVTGLVGGTLGYLVGFVPSLMRAFPKGLPVFGKRPAQNKDIERVPEKLLDFSDENSRKTKRIEHFHESTLHGNALESRRHSIKARQILVRVSQKWLPVLGKRHGQNKDIEPCRDSVKGRQALGSKPGEAAPMESRNASDEEGQLL